MADEALTSLTCEGRSCPLGIDEPSPRLGWIPLVRQAAYRLTVTADPASRDDPAGPFWDSDWIEERNTSAPYAGPPLAPRTRYRFSVRIRDAAGRERAPAAEAWFETGLLSSDAWPSEWIRAPAAEQDRGQLFLRAIDIPEAPRTARAYVAGLGYHELHINGRRSGENVLDPAWTDYRRKIYYVVHDLTALLAPGRNIVAVMVAPGRARAPVLNLRLFLAMPDGTEREECTNHRTWWWSPATPVLGTDIYHGETCDARIRVPGWDAADDATAFPPVGAARPLTAEPPGGMLRAQDLEPIRVVEDIVPVSSHAPGGEPLVVVYDLGQNIAGWVLVRARGRRGSTIRLGFSEALRDDGWIEPLMNRGARATDVFILAGSGRESWEPRFTYHGFRYVQVECDAPLEEFSLVGRVVRSSVQKIGWFACADELATRIRTACEWTEADNLHSLPTDCPQREERMGWLNDMTVRAESAMYTFDLGRLYAKWTDDIALSQGELTGAVPDVAPFDAHRTPAFGHLPADPVCSSYLLVPWLCYVHYADRRTLERRYAGLVRWYEYLLGQAEDGILAYSYWGDWASPARFSVEGSVGGGAVSAVTPGALVSTAHLFYDARLLRKMATAIGRPDDAERFGREAMEIGRAFNERFWNAETRWYGTGSQACQAIPLTLGLVPPDREDAAAERLARDIEATDTHLSTGNLATRYALEALAEHGRVDLAWALVVQRSYPSWGYMLDHGATTIWERWEHIRGGAMSSHNHPMYATVSGWFSKYVCGIRASEESPGFAEVVIRPHVPTGLAWAEAGLDTVRGPVRSGWRRRADGSIEYTVDIPPSSTARLELPDLSAGEGPCGRRCSMVDGGSHRIVIGRE